MFLHLYPRRMDAHLTHRRLLAYWYAHRHPHYRIDNWLARHHNRPPCGCLMENVALYGHRDGCPLQPIRIP